MDRTSQLCDLNYWKVSKLLFNCDIKFVLN